MANAKSRTIEGHYSYYGHPAYILKQKNGAYASGFFDPSDKVFKAGGSVKRILWDGVKIGTAEAKRLMDACVKSQAGVTNDGPDDPMTPEWILLPDDASLFLSESDESHYEAAKLVRRSLKRRQR